MASLRRVWAVYLYGGAAITRRPWPVGWGACADRCTGFPAANPDRTRPVPAV